MQYYIKNIKMSRFRLLIAFIIILCFLINFLIDVRKAIYNRNIFPIKAKRKYNNDDDTIQSFIYYGKKTFLSFRSSSRSNVTIFVSHILSRWKNFSLTERLTLKNNVKKKSLIYSNSIDFNNQKLRSCPDWNCEITNDISRVNDSNAIIASLALDIPHEPNIYNIFYSQESPLNSFYSDKEQYNMTLGYRHDSEISSPYGFTVRLAQQSRRTWTDVLSEIEPLINSKKKPIAWYVSHCFTNSKREIIANEIQNLISMDVVGNCGNIQCNRNNKCEKQLDTDYYFYFAAENSVCTDYVTEKLWSNGFNHTIVPIVLRRSIVEDIAPPNSFIAVDDFHNVDQLVDYLKMLINDKEKYLSYFKWKTDYETIILDSNVDLMAERPWGFCQICRLTQLNVRPKIIIPNMKEYWDCSCEESEKLLNEISIKRRI